MRNADLYETDFFAWAHEQAALLRAGRLSEADIENIAEEIESMGRSEKRELVSRLAVLIAHLLKWRTQPGLRGQSWRLTILEQRDMLGEHLRDNPSLRVRLPDAIATAFRQGRLVAQRETGFPDEAFPSTCPWTAERIMDESFWPDADPA